MKLAVRNMARQLRRTVLTGLLFLVAAATLVVTTSVANGVGQMMDESVQQYLTGGVMLKGAGNKADLGKLRTGKIATIDAWREVERILAERGDVAGFSKRISFTAMLAFGEKQAFATVAGLEEKGQGAAPAVLKEGKGLSAGNGGVLVSSKQAEKLGLQVGDTVHLQATDRQGHPQSLELKVEGILSTVNFDLLRQSEVRVSYADAASLFGTDGAPTEYLITAADTRLLAGELGPALRTSGVVAQHWTEAGAELLKSKDQLRLAVLGAFGLFSVVIVAMIFTMMQLQIAERIREIGAISAMGMTWPQILRLLLTETMLLGAASSSLGAGLTYAGLRVGAANGVHWGESAAAIFGETVLFPTISPGIVAVYIAALTLLGVLGAFLPALRAARINPADSFRFV